jgi:aminocarboxymuconate-semialdehyde decarboxylase
MSAARKSRTVDIHAHAQIAAAEALTRPAFRPEKMPILRFTSPETQAVNAEHMPVAARWAQGIDERLAEMDATGIDVQVLSPTPGQYYYWAEPELGRAAARLVNDGIAEMAGQRPERFAALGTIPLQEPRLAVEELRRCVRELGMRGVEIDTNVAGTELSAPELRPFWSAAEELGAFVFMHPLGFTHGDRLSKHYLANIIGNPLESAIAVAHLIFEGVLDDHPRLTICVAHGGGYLPAYSGRMAHAFRERPDCRGCRESPDTYLNRLYYDTVVYDSRQLHALIERYGSDHVLLGTDWPYDMRELDPLGLIDAVENLTDAARANICGGNAERLLGLSSSV